MVPLMCTRYWDLSDRVLFVLVLVPDGVDCASHVYHVLVPYSTARVLFVLVPDGVDCAPHVYQVLGPLC